MSRFATPKQQIIATYDNNQLECLRLSFATSNPSRLRFQMIKNHDHLRPRQAEHGLQMKDNLKLPTKPVRGGAQKSVTKGQSGSLSIMGLVIVGLSVQPRPYRSTFMAAPSWCGQGPAWDAASNRIFFMLESKMVLPRVGPSHN